MCAVVAATPLLSDRAGRFFTAHKSRAPPGPVLLTRQMVFPDCIVRCWRGMPDAAIRAPNARQGGAHRSAFPCIEISELGQTCNLPWTRWLASSVNELR